MSTARYLNPRKKKNKGILLMPDILTLMLYLALVFMGWVSIYSVGFEPGAEGNIFSGGRTSSQIIWMGIAAASAISILLLDANFLRRSSLFFYVAMILLLIVTIFISPNIKGSHSWIAISETMRIQPAEFAKVTTAMMLSWWCSRYEFDIKKNLHLMVSILIFVLPILIIIMQSETGSALVYLSFILVLYREGLPGAVPAFGIFIAILFVVVLRYSTTIWGVTHAGTLLAFILIYLFVFIANAIAKSEKALQLIALITSPALFLVFGLVSIFTKVNFVYPALIALVGLLIATFYFGLKHQTKSGIYIALSGLLCIGLAFGVEYFFNEILQPHQQNRILVTLGMKDDPAGAGYNVHQSLIAIGSGGLTGKGFLKGTQTKLSYVPEQDTDFIFCTVAEEFGFIGSVVVLAVFLALILRIIVIAERQSYSYARIYGYSVACILFFHLLVNIGMVLGITPVIGIPLPFFSYGGSSLLSFTILLFILLRLDATNIPIQN